MDQLQKQAHQLLNQLQQSRQPVDKNLNHSNNITLSHEHARQVCQVYDTGRSVGLIDLLKVKQSDYF